MTIKTAPVQQKQKLIVSLLIVFAWVILDQATKLVAAANLRGRPGLSYLGDSFRLEYAENTGAFLSLGAQLDQGTRSLFFIFGVVIIIGFCVLWLVRSANTWLTVVALSSVISGGVGNLIDRVWRGYVIDFIYMGVGPLHTGVLNIADIAITGGLMLMLWDQYWNEKKEA